MHSRALRSRAGLGRSVEGFPSSNLVGLRGLEPPTSRLSGVRSNHLSYKPMFLSGSCFLKPFVKEICFKTDFEATTRMLIREELNKFVLNKFGGDKRDRTADPLLAKQVLSQLSYIPLSSGASPKRTLTIEQRLLCSSNP